jgi:chromosome segregation protein
VNANFKRIYGQITLGGDAFLELENPEKPFEGGLIMKAQPPGKKVARLQALSGGEKSMTALALIFAIQEYEPSPFYLLDEVDQNLDGVNAELAARRMSQESSTAQFVVISLRKVTLKEADHIYGVTMAGNGLSQVIGNFDFNQITEQGELVQRGDGGTATALLPPPGPSGNDGGNGGNAKKSKKSIRETVESMMKVEVDK